MARLAMKRVLKKPSGPPEAKKEKKASWQTYAKEDSEEEAPDGDSKDLAPITKQQRYIFDKALQKGHVLYTCKHYLCIMSDG